MNARQQESRELFGFTLIELLVVVAIIALLISILLPSLGQARERGKRTVCLSQLRELTTALRQYADEYKDRCFPYNPDNIYLQALRPYHLNIEALRFCPNAKRVFAPSGNVKGTAEEGWRLGQQTGSYGLNGYLYVPYHNDPMRSFTPARYPDSWFAALSSAERTSDVPTFGDCNWVDGFPTPDDTVPADLTTGWRVSGEFPYHMGRFAIARHDRNINMIYLDGHGALLALRRLWNLRWSRTFELRGERSDL